MATDIQTQIRQNLGRLIRQPGGNDLRQLEDDSYEARCEYVCDWTAVLDLMPKRYVSRHPDFANLICSEVSAVRESPGIARVSATYTGKPDGTSNAGGTGKSEPIEELGYGVRQEAIETHPDFNDWKAASRAIVDGDGQFKGFVAGDDLFGVDSFLSPGGTYTRRYTQTTKPTSITTVGKIVGTPTGAPTTNSPYNWLKGGVTWTRRGGIFEVTESWLLSGPRGWSSDIYDSGGGDQS